MRYPALVLAVTCLPAFAGADSYRMKCTSLDDEPHKLGFTIDLRNDEGWPGRVPWFFSVTSEIDGVITLKEGIDSNRIGGSLIVADTNEGSLLWVSAGWGCAHQTVSMDQCSETKLHGNSTEYTCVVVSPAPALVRPE